MKIEIHLKGSLYPKIPELERCGRPRFTIIIRISLEEDNKDKFYFGIVLWK